MTIITVAAVLKDPCSKFWGPGVTVVIVGRVDSDLDDTEEGICQVVDQLSSNYPYYCVPVTGWLGDTCSVLITIEMVVNILVVETGR